MGLAESNGLFRNKTMLLYYMSKNVLLGFL
jgi:hypothetical protein